MSNALTAPRHPASFVSASGFAAAVKPILPVVTRFARRLTASSTDSEDLVQETLTRAWAARDRFQPGTNLKAWLLRIAYNSFLAGRRRARWQAEWSDELMERQLVTGPGQEFAIQLGELDTAFAALPADQRDAFQEVVVRQHSYEEAADLLHAEVGTVKSRVARARVFIAQALDGGVAPRPAKVDPPANFNGEGRESAYERWKRSGSRLIG